VANFTAATTGGCSPLVVSFSDQSTGNPTIWFWDFGNGATSTLKNPSTTYFLPGQYTVTLTVTNSSGVNTKVQQNFIVVHGKPTVLFAGNDSLGCFPFPVNFTDLSIASPGTVNTAWVWDFGDGQQSSAQNTSNVYTNTGNYTVSLKVTNDKGCWSTFTKPAYIKIDGGVEANFSSSQPTVCRLPVTINFTNASTGPGVLSYQWLFGDGGTSTQQNPAHTYTAPGTYSVTLITKSSNGCVDTLRKTDLLILQNTVTSFTAPDSVCVGEGVNFTNTSSVAAQQTAWNFGNGVFAFTTSGVYAYPAPGTYTVQLQQQYGHCTDSASKSIKVRPKPVANFSADRTAFCQTPATVNFTSTSADAVNYLWDFGDGTTSTQQNPTHTYTTYGGFNVTLVVTNDLGCTDTLVRGQQGLPYITVQKPNVVINQLPTEGCVPYTFNFSASVTSSDPITSYLWDLGNGITSSAQNPSYTYTATGTHDISLAVTTASGCTETVTVKEGVKVGTKPTVSFDATPREVCAFKEVYFTSSGTNVTDYLWQFGDGGTSTLANPVYQYGDTGTFNVTLIVKNNGCKDSLKIDDFVTIKPPIAIFTWQSTCTDRLRFEFTDKSKGATTWFWDFGDGNTSTLQNPVHTYAAYGTYAVKLLVTNDSCQHQAVQMVKTAVGTPDFSADTTWICKGGTVQLAADTTNMANLVGYEWDFGNGTTASGMNTSAVYGQSGYYTVRLTVTDYAGCKSTVTKPQYIRVHGPKAGFIAANNNGCKGLTATFTDTSKWDGFSNIKTWQWNFGDGTSINAASSQTYQHVYTQPGSFAVSLKVIDSSGCVDSVYRPALVNTSNIKADFVSADTLSCPGAVVQFANQSVASAAFTSIWEFGNGDTSTLQNPTVSYAADGVYSVQLKIRDAFGCRDSLTRTNYINIKHPVAAYSVSDTASSCTPFQVNFTNTSSYFATYIWDLGGGTSALLNPVQYYTQPGTYQTRLIVESVGGCRDTAEKTIFVNDVSGARLSYLPLSGCKPLTVDLNAVAPANMHYVWDFGDGTIINSQDTVTQHVYNFFGDFVPKLILTDGSGCVIPVIGPDTIRIKGATAKFAVDKKLLCDSGMVRFLDSTTFNNPITSYRWDFGDGTISTQSTPTHYYSQPGLYPVSLNVLTQNSCVDTFRLTAPVKVVASPLIRIDGDTVICVGEGLLHKGEFDRVDTSQVNWAWNFPNGRTAATQYPQPLVYTEPGRFTIQTIATNSSGCVDTAVKRLLVNPLPWVTLPTTLTTRTGTPVPITATYFGGVVSYNWTYPESLDCSTCPEPVATPKFDTRYRVDFVDSNGCRNNGYVQVLVFCNNDNVFVPNTFSPNGDGSNDVFYVRGKGLSRVKSLRIFNRWGQVVFDRSNFAVNDASAGWNGTYNGAKAKPDVYIYQLEIWCDNANVVKFEGNIALIQ
jgi:gliding motility-associated-like protein